MKILPDRRALMFGEPTKDDSLTHRQLEQLASVIVGKAAALEVEMIKNGGVSTETTQRISRMVVEACDLSDLHSRIH